MMENTPIGVSSAEIPNPDAGLFIAGVTQEWVYFLDLVKVDNSCWRNSFDIYHFQLSN